MTTALPINSVLIINGAKRAARLYTPDRLAHWREDIAAEIVVDVVEANLKGIKLSRRMYALLAIQAMRRLLGTHSSKSGRRLRSVDLWRPVSETDLIETPNELAPLALWRLQRVWADLTELQQLGLYQLMSGRELKEVARENGIGFTNLFESKRSALARLDNANTSTRKGRKSACIEMGCTTETGSKHGRCVKCQARIWARERLARATPEEQRRKRDYDKRRRERLAAA